ncbi:MAG TPA: methyl-accepting chemotaxis protein [Xanthobacteraceae bacterium]|nr:methyl-accepting chemotaxis protein [Xanthobacteraceae bacterium]
MAASPQTAWHRLRHSLGWRLIVPIPVALAAAIALVWALVPPAISKSAVDEAIRAGVQTAAQFKIVRGYYTENVVNKLKKQGVATATFDHKNDGKAIPLPATMIHDLSELLAGKDTTVNLFSAYPFPNRKDRRLDAFQQQAWDFLTVHPDATFSRTEERDGKQIVRVAVADRMSAQSCIDCHNSSPLSPKTDWKLGDVRGVLEVDSMIDQQIADGASLSRTVVFGAVGIGLALIVILLIVTRGVIRPLRGMTDRMTKLAAKDFSVEPAGLERKDEIGEMARAVEVFRTSGLAFERMRAEQAEQEQRAAEERRAATLKLAGEFEGVVGNIVDSVTSAATNLEATAGALAHTAETTQQLTGTVAGASQEASANVQSAAAAADEMSSSVGEIARHVQESTAIAAQAVTQAKETDTRIVKLSDAANRIGDVVKLINDVAEQTNLLALNATIEAARAGEAGKGFAVVAHEVKALATQTARATGEIATQIAAMQAATKESVGAIKEIGDTVERIAEIARTIAGAVEEQGTATEGIARNVRQAARGTADLTTSIGDVNRGAAETGAASAQVFSSAQSLSRESSRLKVEVGRFLASVRNQ